MSGQKAIPGKKESNRTGKSSGSTKGSEKGGLIAGEKGLDPKKKPLIVLDEKAVTKAILVVQKKNHQSGTQERKEGTRGGMTTKRNIRNSTASKNRRFAHPGTNRERG